MKRTLAAVATALLVSTPLWAPPQNNPTVAVVSSAPSGGCTSNEIRLVRGTDEHYSCTGGQWTLGKTKVGDLASTNLAAANLCMSVDPSDITKVQYVACGSGGGSGTSAIKECSGAPPCAGTANTVSSATTMAFGPGFDVAAATTTSTNDTADVTLDLTENPVTLSSAQVAGVLPITNGGTNANSASNARNQLGAAASGVNSDINQITNLTTPLTAPQGGTGVNTATDDNVLIGNGSAYISSAIPACTDVGGNHLNYNTSTNALSCGNSSSGGAGSGYATIQNAGSNLTTRTIFNVATSGSGTALAGADNSGSTRTDITLTTTPTGATAVVGSARTLTGGAGIAAIGDLSADRTITVDSTEQAFITSGTLTCGAATNGKMEVNSSTPLQYCDNAATPTLQYAAYGDSSGNAKTGDSAAGFFPSGTALETTRGGTGNAVAYTDQKVIFSDGGTLLGDSDSFTWDKTLNQLTIGILNTDVTGNSDGNRYLQLSNNPTVNPAAPAAGKVLTFANGTDGQEVLNIRTSGGGIQPIAAGAATDDSVLVANGTKWVTTALPAGGTNGCSGATTDKVLYNSATNAFSCGTDQSSGAGGTPGGTTTQVQYNNAGAFGGTGGFTWTSGTSTLAMADGLLLDLSAINGSGTGEGLKLPQATSCASSTAEGQVCWDTDDDVPTYGTGAANVAGMTTTSVSTLTNKTLDVEATGNNIATVDVLDFPAAGCNNTTASSFYDLPGTNPAVAACRTGTNTTKGVLGFADGANTLSAYTWFRLPSDWNASSNIDAIITWISGTTTNDVVWQIAIACASDGDSDDPAFTNDAFTADTAKGTANQLNDTASNTVTTTGTCAAGDIAYIRIQRDPTVGGDTHAATANLVNLELKIRRTQ